ncbi:MAG: VWA domain-containing protein [Candidatus Anaerobiospirillum pullicola]|uniref:VWA domain-containing protein n=1 Tax=Candidatus Anaerobiospirillum pullicola TaxID=2838451 RepID=A0A948TER9_9GAMM|nr:VWA domain-containing protein [Candidatus Anaerobiospirillum pullicola]
MEGENLTRWRLALGGDDKADGTGATLSEEQERLDMALAALYDGDMSRYKRFKGKGKGAGAGNGKGGRQGGSASSAPYVATWLGEIRELFPQSMVKVLQQDAIDRLHLRELLLEPEMLENVVPDVHLVATIMSLGQLIPEKNKELVRQVIATVVEQLLQKLRMSTEQAVTGALNKSARKRNPRANEINWDATIRKNLRHYQSDLHTIIPEELVGYGRKGRKLKDIILCIDQSGSMGTSVVYSAVFGAVLASIPAVSTRMVVFDTSVVDLSDKLHDPVDVLLGVQLGGGTDINQALTYCQGLVHRPDDTIMVVITDLYEGGDRKQMYKRFADLVASGVQVVVLLALSDDGAPFYDQEAAQFLANLGICAFACTPDKFPDLMGAVINKQDLSLWVAQNINDNVQL